MSSPSVTATTTPSISVQQLSSPSSDLDLHSSYINQHVTSSSQKPEGFDAPVFIAHNAPMGDTVSYGQHPLRVVCQFCKETVTTHTTPAVGVYASLVSGLMCLCGCFPCAWIPCVCNSCKNVKHWCPICERKVGMYKNVC